MLQHGRRETTVNEYQCSKTITKDNEIIAAENLDINQKCLI